MFYSTFFSRSSWTNGKIHTKYIQQKIFHSKMHSSSELSPTLLFGLIICYYCIQDQFCNIIRQSYSLFHDLCDQHFQNMSVLVVMYSTYSSYKSGMVYTVLFQWQEQCESCIIPYVSCHTDTRNPANEKCEKSPLQLISNKSSLCSQPFNKKITHCILRTEMQ